MQSRAKFWEAKTIVIGAVLLFCHKISNFIIKNIHWEGLNEPPDPTLVVFGTAFSHAIGALSSVSALKSNLVFAPEMCAR